jgi:hypothetical protein
MSLFRTLLFFVSAIVAFVLYRPAPGYSQDIQALSGVGVEANLLAGKVYRHEAKFTLPIPALTTGADVNLIFHTYGKKSWQQRLGYPTIGIGATYTNYGIDSVYGRCFSLYPNLIFRLLGNSKLQWTLRVGDGIGYVTKTFSRTAPVDTTNVAIGNHFNDFIMVMTSLQYHINRHWDIQAGAALNHISNGSYKKPNLGINVFSGHFGFAYYPVTSRPPRLAADLKPLANRWLVQASAQLAMVSSYTAGGPVYPVYITSAYLSRRWHSTNKVFAGIDYSYHTDIYSFLRNNELAPGQERRQSYKSALIAGNEFLLGRVGIMLQAGLYLKQAYIVKDAVYEKVGVNYYAIQKERGGLKELFFSVFLKSHMNVAEMGGIGMGIGF